MCPQCSRETPSLLGRLAQPAGQLSVEQPALQAPAPVSRCATRCVHPRATRQAEKILKLCHRQRRRCAQREPDERPPRTLLVLLDATCTQRCAHASTRALPQRAPPTHQRVLVVRAGVKHAPDGLRHERVLAFGVRIVEKLQYGHPGNALTFRSYPKPSGDGGISVSPRTSGITITTSSRKHQDHFSPGSSERMIGCPLERQWAVA